VTGAGAIGLFTLFILKAYGARQWTWSSRTSGGTRLARALGARAVWRPAEAATGAAELPAGFECSARNDAFALLQRQLAPHGRLCVLSDSNVEPLTLTAAFHEKELRVVGSSDGWDTTSMRPGTSTICGRLPRAWLLSSSCGIAAEELAGDVRALAQGELQPVKVLVHYG